MMPALYSHWRSSIGASDTQRQCELYPAHMGVGVRLLTAGIRTNAHAKHSNLRAGSSLSSGLLFRGYGNIELYRHYRMRVSSLSNETDGRKRFGAGAHVWGQSGAAFSVRGVKLLYCLYNFTHRRGDEVFKANHSSLFPTCGGA